MNLPGRGWLRPLVIAGGLLLIAAHLLLLAGVGARIRLPLLLSGGVVLLVLAKHVGMLGGILGLRRRFRSRPPDGIS